MGPDITHHPLARADGSVTFSSELYTILAAVNGPIEVQRRDELPEEAAIEVNLRPSSGVGGPRERWLESVVAATLRSIILVHLHPRTLVQITLQVTKEPTLKLKGAIRDVSILPSLLNASLMGLVDGGIPLQTSIAATLATISTNGSIDANPNEKALAACKSIHALAYNRRGEMVLDESSGDFDLDTWEGIVGRTEKTCLASMASPAHSDEMINGDDAAEPWLRTELESRARDAAAWRETT